MSNRVTRAFAEDGYKIIKTCPMTGKQKSSARTAEVSGCTAAHLTAINRKSNKPKLAYYLEGTAYQMGFQMGSLAPARVKAVVKGFVPAFLGGYIHGNTHPFLKDLLVEALTLYIDDYLPKVKPAIPDILLEEIDGMVAALNINPKNKISAEEILRVNTAQDILLARVSNPLGLSDKLLDIARRYGLHDLESMLDANGGLGGVFKTPRGCHAFSAFGSAVKDKDTHFFGRDWMFSGGWWLAENAALFIYNPGDGRKPLASASLPGLIGSLMSMNIDGIAMGVDNVIVTNNNPHKPGFNSTLLIRHCIHNAASAEEVVAIAQKARRGASYLYPVSDGTNNRACTIEATASVKSVDPLQKIPESLSGLLPTAGVLKQQKTKPIVNGMIARWSTDNRQGYFLKYNKALFEHFGKTYDKNAWGTVGSVFNSYVSAPEGFGPYFFNPVRLKTNDLHITTNAAESIPTRLTEMFAWGKFLTQPYWTDFQWRYDSLNNLLQKNMGAIAWNNAWKIINFISPATGTGKARGYYFNQDWSIEDTAFSYTENGVGKTSWAVPGMITLSEVRKEKKVRALYGTYADQPVEITLPNYIE